MTHAASCLEPLVVGAIHVRLHHSLRPYRPIRAATTSAQRLVAKAKLSARSRPGVAAAPQVFDSRTLPFNFALEMFEKHHVTPPHTHPAGHELFYILQGEGMVRVP